VTEFQRNINDYVGQLKAKKTPLVLTVNGRAELVVQDAESYQEILDRLERAETIASIRRGMKDADEGRMMPLEDAVSKLRAKHGL
jgi:prevent-host-death family protein